MLRKMKTLHSHKTDNVSKMATREKTLKEPSSRKNHKITLQFGNIWKKDLNL